ncbi:MAG: hypothetical protein ACI81P_002556, partial [Neolewinella sp.]
GVDCGGPDCAACPTCTDGIQNGSETGVDCGGPDCAACLLYDQGIVNGISDAWVSVPLSNAYGSMVVVATVVTPNSSTAPVITRIRNASGSAFELRVQTTNGISAGSYDVHYFVIEEGVYTVAQDGVKLEAVKVNSSVTAEDRDWSIEPRSYQQAYSAPVILGQVMSFNDSDWSTFWASSANSRKNPPSSSSFGAGKHVGEDPDKTRATELIGYIVIEAGSGTIGQTEYAAGLGADIVRGVQNTSTGYAYGLSGLTSASSAILSAATMDGKNGGWPVLYGSNPFISSQLRLAFDEDVAKDSERSHTTEQVAYLAFGTSAGAGNCSDGIQNGLETGIDCGGPNCAVCLVNYCSSIANSSFYEHIASVTIAGITNTSGDNNGYGDFTANTPIPLVGTVALTLTPGFSGYAYTQGWVVYVDFNADGDFTDAGERVLQVPGSSTVSGTITVPPGLTGTSRLRIQMRYNAYNNSSCGAYAEGEVEDYTVSFGGGAKRTAPVVPSVNLFDADPILELFPNPARMEINVRIPLQGMQDDASWFIIDVAGKVVLEGKTSAATLRSGLNLGLRNLPSGMYYFSLNSTEVRTTKRFIVQR